MTLSDSGGAPNPLAPLVARELGDEVEHHDRTTDAEKMDALYDETAENGDDPDAGVPA